MTLYGCFHVSGATQEESAKLHECARSFSPHVEAGSDYAIADVRGLGKLIGTPKDVAMRMAAALQTAGLRGNVAVAHTVNAAVAAARGIPGITAIAEGDEARTLAHLPLALLNPSEKMAKTLATWGIRTFGELSKLPQAGLANRLGREGTRLHEMAGGISTRLVVPEPEPHVFESSVELEHPVESLESLAVLLERMLIEICGELVTHGLAALELKLKLRLENRTHYARTISLPFASTDTGTFLKLLEYDLAADPPPAAILHVHLQTVPASQRRLQGGLFIPVAPEAEKLELTLARLAGIVGKENVGSPEILDTHRPDAFRITRFVARADAPVQEAYAAVASPPLAIRLFRPPLPAQVSAPEGVPRNVRASGINGNVIRFAGPWRTSGDWWRPDPWLRDEWDVALDGGSLYRVFHEPKKGWFVGGNYD